MNAPTHRIVVALLAMAGAVAAQDNARGHWTGSIETPDNPLAVEVDLDKAANGWIGSISIPAQNAAGLPLDNINVASAKCSFRIKGAPGSPSFDGALSADGKTMSGQFTQGGGTMPFKLTRAGDPVVTEIKKSTAVAKPFVGTWEGTLEAGQSLRLEFRIANDEGGSSAVIVSLDQGGAEIPVNTITQAGSKITLIAKTIDGEYSGEINGAGDELRGTWSQHGNDLPLNLKKKGEQPAKK